MKKITQFSTLCAVIFTLAILPVQTVSAVTVNTVNDNGNFVDSSFSADGLLDLAIDFDFNNPVTLDVILEPDDLGKTLDFQGVFQNFTSEAWQSFNFTLTGDATFTDSSDINPFTADLGAVSRSPNGVTINFASIDEEQGFEFGLDTGPWQIDISALSAGDSFGLAVEPSAVPIPAAVWLFSTGLIGLIAGVKRRWTKQH